MERKLHNQMTRYKQALVKGGKENLPLNRKPSSAAGWGVVLVKHWFFKWQMLHLSVLYSIFGYYISFFTVLAS